MDVRLGNIEMISSIHRASMFFQLISVHAYATANNARPTENTDERYLPFFFAVGGSHENQNIDFSPE